LAEDGYWMVGGNRWILSLNPNAHIRILKTEEKTKPWRIKTFTSRDHLSFHVKRMHLNKL
jgi:hypothetical protein